MSPGRNPILACSSLQLQSPESQALGSPSAADSAAFFRRARNVGFMVRMCCFGCSWPAGASPTGTIASSLVLGLGSTARRLPKMRGVQLLNMLELRGLPPGGVPAIVFEDGVGDCE
eukprot:CAMPEP_0179012118 /NCGR_PEP_ID=MMETSP0796-20121207/1027_1 /TAXON_ID=73915 /ORGANISM="Pyrodinium bahamense, Strain pbaha01" /LENGTH=115 /DNA_ID=CAMNT_0020707543 /DNA_START=83 /DNA_END=427 /DNA_ORIENTATION=-